MVDVVLLVLGFFYVGQTIDILVRKAMDKDRPVWLLALPAALFPAYFLGPWAFNFVLLFLAIFWSNACRSSGYGLNYHFPLVVAGGLVYGPVAGLVLGILPLIFVPYIRPDAQIIAIYLSAILLGAVGAISGLIWAFGPALWVGFAVWALVVFNVIRAMILFGKLSPKNTVFFAVVNIGVSYYLITNYLVTIVKYLEALPIG